MIKNFSTNNLHIKQPNPQRLQRSETFSKLREDIFNHKETEISSSFFMDFAQQLPEPIKSRFIRISKEIKPIPLDENLAKDLQQLLKDFALPHHYLQLLEKSIQSTYELGSNIFNDNKQTTKVIVPKPFNSQSIHGTEILKLNKLSTQQQQLIIKCLPPKMPGDSDQNTLALYIANGGFGNDSERLMVLLGALSKIKFTSEEAVENIVTAIRKRRFGNNELVLNKVANEIIKQLDLTSVKSQKIFVGAIVSNAFSNSPKVLNSLAKNLRNINFTDASSQIQLATFIKKNGFGNDKEVLNNLRQSLGLMQFTDGNSQRLLCDAIIIGRLGTDTESRMHISELINQPLFSDPIAQLGVVQLIRSGDYMHSNQELSPLVNLAASLSKINFISSQTQKDIVTLIKNGKFGSNKQVLLELAKSIGQIKFTDYEAQIGLLEAIKNNKFGDYPDVIRELVKGLGKIRFSDTSSLIEITNLIMSNKLGSMTDKKEFLQNNSNLINQIIYHGRISENSSFKDSSRLLEQEYWELPSIKEVLQHLDGEEIISPKIKDKLNELESKVKLININYNKLSSRPVLSASEKDTYANLEDQLSNLTHKLEQELDPSIKESLKGSIQQIKEELKAFNELIATKNEEKKLGLRGMDLDRKKINLDIDNLKQGNVSLHYNELIYCCDDEALAVSQEYISKFLYHHSNNKDINWDNIIWIKNNQIKNVGVDAEIGEIFKKFPVFADSYSRSIKNARFGELIRLLNVGNLTQHFIDALQKKAHKVDMTNKQEESLLINALNPFIKANCQIREDGSIVPEVDAILAADDAAKKIQINQDHVDGIMNAFKETLDNVQTSLTTKGVEKTSNELKAQLLLTLSAVFMRYSSSSFFGTEGNSPIPIRNYAIGLLNAAVNLDNNLVDSEKSNNDKDDWWNRASGANPNSFTCTEVLSQIMLGYCKQKIPEMVDAIVPPAWH